MAVRIKKDDQVIVLTGKDKGQKGQVLEVLPKKNKVLVKGVAMATHHTKAKKQGETSKISKQESYIDISNVMAFCASCKKASRMNSKLLDSGDKVRVCNRCQEIM